MHESDFDSYTLMPGYSSLESRDSISLSTNITVKKRINIPIVSSPMSTVTEWRMAYEIDRLGGVGVIHRYMKKEEQSEQIKTFRDRSPGLVGAAIGAKDGMERIEYLESAHPPDFYMFDIANGDLKECYNITKNAARQGLEIISGNIVTSSAAARYYEAGASGFRVGLGSGSVCITRKVTGFGRNQLEAIQDIYAQYPEIPITSCGGIRDSGDIVKALSFGADSVIIGRLFATCDESPAPRLPDGRVTYGGMASYFSENMRAMRTGEDPDDIHHMKSPEGIHELLEPIGPLSNTVTRLVGGIEAGLAYYGGAKNIKELQETVEWEPV